MYGSVRGAISDGRPYRNSYSAKPRRLGATPECHLALALLDSGGSGFSGEVGFQLAESSQNFE